MNYFEFITEYKTFFRDATPEQVQQAWERSGYAPAPAPPLTASADSTLIGKEKDKQVVQLDMKGVVSSAKFLLIYLLYSLPGSGPCGSSIISSLLESLSFLGIVGTGISNPPKAHLQISSLHQSQSIGILNSSNTLQSFGDGSLRNRKMVKK